MVKARTSSGVTVNEAQMSIEEYIVMSAPFRANRSDAKIMEARFADLYLAAERQAGHVAKMPAGDSARDHMERATERRMRVLNYLSNVPFATVADIETGIGSEWARVKRALAELVAAGAVVSMHVRNSEYLHAVSDNADVLRKHINERKRNANKTRDRRTIARPKNGAPDRKPARSAKKVQRGGSADRGAS